jgi:hypothetical protein
MSITPVDPTRQPGYTTHACVVPECQRQISSLHLMCQPHWRVIDPTLADQLWFAWRASVVTHNPTLKAVGEKRMQTLLQHVIKNLP